MDLSGLELGPVVNFCENGIHPSGYIRLAD